MRRGVEGRGWPCDTNGPQCRIRWQAGLHATRTLATSYVDLIYLVEKKRCVHTEQGMQDGKGAVLTNKAAKSSGLGITNVTTEASEGQKGKIRNPYLGFSSIFGAG